MRELEEEDDYDDETQTYKMSALPIKRRRGRPKLEKNAHRDNLESWNEGISIFLKTVLYNCREICKHCKNDCEF